MLGRSSKIRRTVEFREGSQAVRGSMGKTQTVSVINGKVYLNALPLIPQSEKTAAEPITSRVARKWTKLTRLSPDGRQSGSYSIGLDALSDVELSAVLEFSRI